MMWDSTRRMAHFDREQAKLPVHREPETSYIVLAVIAIVGVLGAIGWAGTL